MKIVVANYVTLRPGNTPRQDIRCRWWQCAPIMAHTQDGAWPKKRKIVRKEIPVGDLICRSKKRNIFQKRVKKKTRQYGFQLTKNIFLFSFSSPVSFPPFPSPLSTPPFPKPQTGSPAHICADHTNPHEGHWVSLDTTLLCGGCPDVFSCCRLPFFPLPLRSLRGTRLRGGVFCILFGPSRFHFQSLVALHFCFYFTISPRFSKLVIALFSRSR